MLDREVANSAARGKMDKLSATLPAATARPPCWGRLLSPRYWPTWAGLGVLRLLSLLPFRIKLAAGAGLGALLRSLPLRYVRIARRNLELCLPDVSAAEREHILRAHFRSLGIGLFETAMSWGSIFRRRFRASKAPAFSTS